MKVIIVRISGKPLKSSRSAKTIQHLLLKPLVGLRSIRDSVSRLVTANVRTETHTVSSMAWSVVPIEVKDTAFPQAHVVDWHGPTEVFDEIIGQRPRTTSVMIENERLSYP